MIRPIAIQNEYGVHVEIEADVVGGIAIHRPMRIELNEAGQPVLDKAGKPVIEFVDTHWRLTHVNSGLSLINARTKRAAIHARKMLRAVDLDSEAALEPVARKTPEEVKQLLRDSDYYLHPQWVWD